LMKQSCTMGALDRGALMAATEMAGGDPTKITAGDFATWAGAKGTEAALTTLGKTIEKIGYNVLRSGGHDVGQEGAFRFRRAEEAPASAVNEHVAKLKTQTPAEIKSGSQRSTARQVFEGIANLGGMPTPALNQGDLPVPASSVYANMTPDQELAFS